MAVIPAVLTIYFAGDAGTYQLLILSQVVLSLQLPFAIIPLIHFTSDHKTMGEFANKIWVKVLAWFVAAIVVSLNVTLVLDEISGWIGASPDPVWIYIIIIPVLCGIAALLLYVTFKPFIRLPERDRVPAWKKLSHFLLADDDTLELDVPHYKRIGVSVSFNDDDQKVLSHAYSLARHHDATLCLFHVVEGAAGQVFGESALDHEAREDEEYLSTLARAIGNRGVETETCLGFGDVPKEIIRMVGEQSVDILVMGGHGHRGMNDILFGSTITPVRHGLGIPIVIVR